MSSLPPLGTGFSDGTRAGPQVLSGTFTGTPGAPISPLFVYDIVPQPASPINIKASGIVLGGVTLTPGSGLVNSGNSGTNTVEIFPTNNQAFIRFDCERAIQITTVAGGSASTFTFYGVDILGNFVTKTLATSASAGTYTSNWTMSGVFRVYVSGPTTTAVSIGCADAFGLPYVAYSPNYLIPYFNGVLDNAPAPILSGTSGAMVTGTVKVVNQNINSDSLIFTTSNTPGAVEGLLSAPSATIVPGVSFNIVASNNAAGVTGTVNYDIVAPSYTAGSATLANSGGVARFTVYNENAVAGVAIRLSVNTFAPAAANAGVLTYVINAVDPDLGPSFTVTSSVNTDQSIVNWQILSVSGQYAGSATLAAGTIVAPNTNVTANTLVFVNYAAATNPGILSAPSAGLTADTSFTVNSSSNTDTSTVVVLLKNPLTTGQYILPDQTNPATIFSGNPRGTYIPSAPSDGFSRLTIWMYNRGVLNANATVGAKPNDPLFANSNVNLYGVTQYTDNNH
jgi:hypothetical protein